MMNNLRNCRESKNLTLEEAAQSLNRKFSDFNITPSTLSKLELGKQSLTDFFLLKFADFYHVTSDYLLNRTSTKSIPIEIDVTYESILSKLNSFSNSELLKISGAIDQILSDRSRKLVEPMTQQRNEYDKQKKTNS